MRMSDSDCYKVEEVKLPDGWLQNQVNKALQGDAMKEQIKLDSAIAFESRGVSCMLFSKITNTALKELQIPKNAAYTIAEMEAIRRCCSLIQAILQQGIEVVQ